jgi:hypothetical protein
VTSAEQFGAGLVGREEGLQHQLGEGDVQRGGERRQRGDQAQLPAVPAEAERNGEAEVIGTGGGRGQVALQLEPEDVTVLGDRAIIRWRYRFGAGEAASVRGVNLMRVQGGRVLEALGYAKSGEATVTEALGRASGG